MERWSRGLLGGGTFLLSVLPFAPASRAAPVNRAAPAVAGESAEAAAGRAALEADVRAALQAAQAERRAAALSRGERQAMVPERPAGPPGEGPVPPVERPVPPPAEAPVPPVQGPVPPPAVSQPVLDAVGQARSSVGGVAGDCEQAVSSLIESLPGGTSRSLSVGEIGFHEVYIYEGRVIDAVAAQYIRNAAMLQQVEQAGLRAAMESGVFTVEEHIQFMRIVRGEQFTVADYLPRGQ